MYTGARTAKCSVSKHSDPLAQQQSRPLSGYGYSHSGPQSRFGDKSLRIWLVLSPQRDCGSKRVKLTIGKKLSQRFVRRPLPRWSSIILFGHVRGSSPGRAVFRQLTFNRKSFLVGMVYTLQPRSLPTTVLGMSHAETYTRYMRMLPCLKRYTRYVCRKISYNGCALPTSPGGQILDSSTDQTFIIRAWYITVCTWLLIVTSTMECWTSSIIWRHMTAAVCADRWSVKMVEMCVCFRG